MWKQRDVSLIGRVQIIKTFITSLFQYSISVVDIPETHIKEMQSVIYTFVWRDKKERLKRRVLIKNKEEGGLKAPSFKFIVDLVKLKCFYKYLTVIANRYEFYCWDTCRKEMFIWYNPGIKTKQYQFFWKSFFDIEILYICDLFEPDGSTIAFEQWLHKSLTHRHFLNWIGLVSWLKKN